MMKIKIYLFFLIFTGCVAYKASTDKDKGSVEDSIVLNKKLSDPSPAVRSIERSEPKYLEDVSKSGSMEKENIAYPKESPEVKVLHIHHNNTRDIVRHEIGLVVYNIPDTMVLGSCYIVKIRINRDTTEQTDIKKDIKQIHTSKIRTSERMEVLIVDPLPENKKAFDIKNTLGDDKSQFVEKDDYTEWVYNICPIRSGDYQLSVVISMVKGDNKKDKSYLSNVTVRNNPIVVVESFWEKYWQWLMTTLILPFVIWIFNRLKKKEK